MAAAARGHSFDNCKWRKNNYNNSISNSQNTNFNSGGMASTDDITVFVIPLKYALNLCVSEDDDDEILSIT